MRRIFLALPLAHLFEREISAFLQKCAGISSVKWCVAPQVHVTLHFFGIVPDTGIQKINGIVGPLAAACHPFEIGLKDVGYFPDRHNPVIVWLGVGGETDALEALQMKIEKSLAVAGFACEKRPFRAHATVGRVRKDNQFKAEREGLLFPATPVKQTGRIALYESKQGQAGSIYEIIQTFDFS